ncbi:hypothetical protein DFH07DRAFT_390269 [Mycena maculata]|uniref:F-box domain-containing protein n=1 Tax=Mycena maculata TaxID=230809 RepID=A0AAD7KF43_9AGAR|nr:hypothetical protein DFH07DRAFT_390269 [Mycena maculata]
MIVHCNDLPSELLVEIFLRYSEDTVELAQPTPNNGPLLLVQVCPLWRRVGLATSQLWNSFSVVTSSDATCLRPDLELVQLWLTRSGVQPLSLGIHNSEDGIDPTPTLRLSSVHSRRWKVVNLLTRRPPSWAEIGVCDAPLLERLLVSWRGSGAEQDIPITSTARLSKLVWQVDRPAPTFNINWSQLTELCLFGFLADVLHVLASCPLLETCDLSIDLSDDAPGLPPVADPPIVLAHLTTLTLDSMRYTAAVAFVFDCIAAPKLLELRAGLYFDFGWPHAAFAGFITRSGCAVKTLGLLAIWMEEDELVEALRLLGALETLEIVNLNLTASEDHVFVADRHLALLTPRADAAETLCPRLTHIVLDRCFAAADGALADMMESRWRAPPEGAIAWLRRVEVVFPDDMVGHDTDRTRAQAVDRGLGHLIQSPVPKVRGQR